MAPGSIQRPRSKHQGKPRLSNGEQVSIIRAMPEPSILGVNHLAVLVSDLRRAEAFYLELLGLPLVKRHFEQDGRHRSTWVALDGTVFLALELPPASGQGPTPVSNRLGHHCVALAITREHRLQWRSRLEAAGVAIERETNYTFYFRDPDGTLLALSHYPELQDAPESRG